MARSELPRVLLLGTGLQLVQIAYYELQASLCCSVGRISLGKSDWKVNAKRLKAFRVFRASGTCTIGLPPSNFWMVHAGWVSWYVEMAFNLWFIHRLAGSERHMFMVTKKGLCWRLLISSAFVGTFQSRFRKDFEGNKTMEESISKMGCHRTCDSYSWGRKARGHGE